MGTFNNRMARATAIFAPALLATACLNIQPKVLGQQGLFDFSAFNGSGVSGSFVFNFALLTTGSTNTVALQGSDNAKSAITGTCNLNGSSCLCNFLDSAGNKLGSTNSSQISYDQGGNYVTCTVPASVTTGQISQVTVQNLDGSVVSTALSVNTAANPLSLNQLIGSSLDANHVRYVYRYQCEYNYLQKNGTSEAGFDCTNQTVSCDSDGNTAKNFCLLKVRIPFFLYSDTYSSNFSSKIADKLYGTTAAPTVCGLSIKQINCVESDVDPTNGGTTDTFGTPVKQFGLYGQSTGIWTTSVSLPSGPNQASASFGFAAPVSTTTGACPPGLVKQIFYTATVLGSTNISPNTNVPASQTLTEISDPSTTPSVVHWAKLAGSGRSGGDCNGTNCVLPVSTNVSTGIADSSYSNASQTAFCVIPASALP